MIEALNPHAQIVFSYGLTKDSCLLQQARVQYILAGYHTAQFRHTSAIKYGSNSLTIRETILGAEHPDTSKSMASLAWTLSQNGNLSKAGTMILRALNVSTKLYLKPECKA